MRNYLLAAVAAAAIASPAVARDGSAYVGVDLGALLVEDSEYDFNDATHSIDRAVEVEYDTGLDAALVGGYDFGLFRVEGELGRKRAGVDKIRLGPVLEDTAEEAFIDADGSIKAWSAMANVLIDIGDQDSWSGFMGGGVGLAKVKTSVDFSGEFPTIPETDFGFHDSDSVMAWQLVAGVREGDIILRGAAQGITPGTPVAVGSTD